MRPAPPAWRRCLKSTTRPTSIAPSATSRRSSASTTAISPSFKTDLGISERLIPLLPRGVIAVSESGILTRGDAERVHAAGACAILVGEALMKTPDPAHLIAEFRGI